MFEDGRPRVCLNESVVFGENKWSYIISENLHVPLFFLSTKHRPSKKLLVQMLLQYGDIVNYKLVSTCVFRCLSYSHLLLNHLLVYHVRSCLPHPHGKQLFATSARQAVLLAAIPGTLSEILEVEFVDHHHH